MRRLSVEVVEVPIQHYSFAQRRMQDFVQFAASKAASGQIDLGNLAASAYLQGIADAGEAIERKMHEALTHGRVRLKQGRSH